MRLGQLSRKLAIRSSEIVAFLATRNIQIEDGTNTRIEEEHEHLVIQHFAPELLMPQSSPEPVATPVLEMQSTPPDEPVTVVESIVEETPETSMEPPVEIEVVKMSEIDKVDVIKAPKVELKGLKVIGKIELPEPKKKEPPVENSEMPVGVDSLQQPPKEVEKKEIERKRPYREDRKKYTERPKRNPIAAQREREAREAEERRKAEAIQLKEKRTQYYNTRVKPPAPTKAARLINEEVVRMEDVEHVKAEPKTWWGRFVRWMTT